MAIQAEAQQLQADATGGCQLGRIGLGGGVGIGGPAIGQMHAGWIQPQGRGEPVPHLGREGAGIGSLEPHVGIEIETAPVLPQLLPFGRFQPLHPPGQGGVDRLHRAAGGQTERALRPQQPLPQQQGGHPVGQVRSICESHQRRAVLSLLVWV